MLTRKIKLHTLIFLFLQLIKIYNNTIPAIGIIIIEYIPKPLNLASVVAYNSIVPSCTLKSSLKELKM